MFTAMIRRPLVWLVGLLALSGAGWLVYQPARDASEPVARSAGPQPGLEEPAPQPAAPSDTAVSSARSVMSRIGRSLAERGGGRGLGRVVVATPARVVAAPRPVAGEVRGFAAIHVVNAREPARVARRSAWSGRFAAFHVKGQAIRLRNVRLVHIREPASAQDGVRAVGRCGATAWAPP